MKKIIINKNYLILFLIPFFLFYLTCEDKKESQKDFGSLSIKIKFENEVTDNSAVKIETDPENKDTKNIGDSLKEKLKEDAIKTDSEDMKNHDTEDENEDDLGALKKEKTSLFSSVKYVKITVGGLQPVEINVSGSTASTTIDDIPAGPQSVSVQLLNSDKLILYQETKTVLYNFKANLGQLKHINDDIKQNNI